MGKGESAVDREMKKLAAMGITVSVTPSARHEDGFENRPSGIIAEAAKRHGIYYGKEQ
ncbi:hypothetical protein [Nesterenkonia sp.]|uniref:hypothetical protein n=1 Tax=Nesterenkonia sp. TaxID=704201 RepID=UPI002628F6E4|nr:hypothetical protein [Nesterenkonia sp.]